MSELTLYIVLIGGTDQFATRYDFDLLNECVDFVKSSYDTHGIEYSIKVQYGYNNPSLIVSWEDAKHYICYRNM
jgi:hypothetical protein